MTTSTLSALAGILIGALALGCADRTNPFPALTTTGELQSDGAGECGAVALSANRALTSAHCVRGGGAVYYHAPGAVEGVKVRRTWIDEKTGGACLDVATGVSDSEEVMTAEEGESVLLEGNITGVSQGTVRGNGLAELRAQKGDSGSAVRSAVSGAVVGVVWGGMTPGAAVDTHIAFTNAEDAARLCASM